MTDDQISTGLNDKVVKMMSENATITFFKYGPFRFNVSAEGFQNKLRVFGGWAETENGIKVRKISREDGMAEFCVSLQHMGFPFTCTRKVFPYIKHCFDRAGESIKDS